MTCPLAATLAHAVTRYDRRQAGRRGYNPNALAIYLRRTDDVVTRMANGEALTGAIETEFGDRLRDSVLAYVASMPADALTLWRVGERESFSNQVGLIVWTSGADAVASWRDEFIPWTMTGQDDGDRQFCDASEARDAPESHFYSLADALAVFALPIRAGG